MLDKHGSRRSEKSQSKDNGKKSSHVSKISDSHTILGRARGPCSQRVRQVYELAKVTLQLQKGPIIGAGQSIWNNVHIHDLSDVYSLLVDAAIAGRTDDGLWGGGAYYLAENGEHAWGELAQQTADAATKMGYLPEAKAEPIDLESAKKYAGFESLS